MVSFVLNSLNVKTDEIAFSFVTDKRMRQLHQDLFNDPAPTDCITCPLDPPGSVAHPHHVLGEAFICPKTALCYATAHQIDPLEEIERYIIHCILHLVGYEDKTARGRSVMKRKEQALLNTWKQTHSL